MSRYMAVCGNLPFFFGRIYKNDWENGDRHKLYVYNENGV